MKLTEIPNNQIIEFSLKSDSIPIEAEARDQIEKLLLSIWEGTDRKGHSGFDWGSLAQNIEWCWMTERGTLPKRIGSWYHKQYLVDLNAEQLSLIGNIARTVIPKDQTYWFDIDTTLDWRGGDFGDESSCFFDSGNNKIPGTSPKIMRNDGRFKAIRFFKPIEKNSSLSSMVTHYYEDKDKFYMGQARAWIFQEIRKGKVISYPYNVIFNGYGQQTGTITRIFSLYTELPSKYVIVTDSGLYINDNGYIITDKEVIDKIDRVSFNEKPYDDRESNKAPFRITHGMDEGLYDAILRTRMGEPVVNPWAIYVDTIASAYNAVPN